jgi:hypothetical protein
MGLGEGEIGCQDEKRSSWVGDEGEEVLGAYLIASPQGARTYKNAGFDKIGERTTIGGNGEGYTHSWFAKRFD